jgi:subtilisin family serine protease
MGHPDTSFELISGHRWSTFSNTGAQDSGPGLEITSAKAGGDLVSRDGTSMATPLVAGVAALWAQKLKQERSFTASEFSTDLVASATTSSLNLTWTSQAVGADIVRAAANIDPDRRGHL